MSQHVSDHLLDRLVANGVRRIFGYPGGGINGIMGTRIMGTLNAGGAIGDAGALELVQRNVMPSDVPVAAGRVGSDGCMNTSSGASARRLRG